MNQSAEIIIQTLTQYLEKNPDIRFAQALFNLNINEFSNKKNPDKDNFLLRDIYNDTDMKILKRMKC